MLVYKRSGTPGSDSLSPTTPVRCSCSTISQHPANKSFSVDGLRIDTAQQVNPEFWSGFQAASGGIHAIGEVWQGSPDVLCPYQNSISGLMNYGAYYWIIQAFQNSRGSMGNLANGMNWMKAVCRDTTLLGSFTENHDIGRFPSMTNDDAQIANSIAFAMMMDGIPIIYQGQEQRFSGHDVPVNREHLWQSKYNKNTAQYMLIKRLNSIRSRAIQRDPAYVTTKASPIYNDANSIVVRKGTSGRQIVGVYTNRGATWSGMVNVKGNTAGFGAYQKLVNAINCKSFTTNRLGDVAVSLVQGMPAVLYPMSELRGSGICGY
jgi:alpha-amylase